MRPVVVWLLLGHVGCASSQAGAPLAESADAAVFDGARADTQDAIPPEDAPKTGCSESRGVRICEHVLVPSDLDSAVRSVGALIGGVGNHVVCYPESPHLENGRVLLHLVGTGSTPDRTAEYLRFACTLGYVGVMPMYENEVTSRSACGLDSPCYENMRREVVYGSDLAPDPIRVDAANSIVHRVDTGWAYLGRQDPMRWGAAQAAFAARDLSRYVLSGHSQGSGHALLLARDFAVDRLIMMGGVPDRLGTDLGEAGRVGWIGAFSAGGSRTPVRDFYGFNHRDDTVGSFDQVDDNYDALGVSATRCDAESANLAVDCRRLEISQQGCMGLLAHAVVTLPAYGTDSVPCAPNGAMHSNLAVFQFLLSQSR